jgi:hypothetical protein
MKIAIGLVVLFTAVAAFGATAKLAFSRSFPGSVPAYFSIEVDRSGALTYKEAPADDDPLKAQLSDADTAVLFVLAEKLGYFKNPIESGLKVANTGKKIFHYEDDNGRATEVAFNYSTLEPAQQLLEKFEQIGETERAFIELDRTMRFDKLGVNDALATVESLWLRKQLATPQQFIPLLTRISSRESYMHLVRERAARLKDAMTAPAASASSEPNQK